MKELIVYSSKCYIGKQNNNVVVKDQNREIIQSMSIKQIEAISLYGNPRISTQLIKLLSKNNVNLFFYSQYGELVSSIISVNSSNYEKQVSQYKANLNADFKFEMAKKLIKNKLKMQYNLLDAYNVDRLITKKEMLNLIEALNKIDKAMDLKELLGIEGRFAKSYFYYLGILVPNDFRFYGRSKRPAKDPFNIILNIGYTLLYRALLGVILKYGLNPGVGFIHKPRNKHGVLASDLMEEWRAVIVDEVAMQLIIKKLITRDHFEVHEDKKIIVTKDGHQIILEAMRERMLEQHHYLYPNKKFYTFLYSINLQIESLLRSIESEKAEDYIVIG